MSRTRRLALSGALALFVALGAAATTPVSANCGPQTTNGCKQAEQTAPAHPLALFLQELRDLVASLF